MKHILKRFIACTALIGLVSTANAGTLCPESAGIMILHGAWASPKFTSCAFDSVAPRGNGEKEISFKVVGQSRVSKLPDKEIWVKGIVVVDNNWHIQSLKWGEYKGAVPPGVTTVFAGKILAGMKK